MDHAVQKFPFYFFSRIFSIEKNGFLCFFKMKFSGFRQNFEIWKFPKIFKVPRPVNRKKRSDGQRSTVDKRRTWRLFLPLSTVDRWPSLRFFLLSGRGTLKIFGNLQISKFCLNPEYFFEKNTKTIFFSIFWINPGNFVLHDPSTDRRFRALRCPDTRWYGLSRGMFSQEKYVPNSWDLHFLGVKSHISIHNHNPFPPNQCWRYIQRIWTPP